MRLARPFVRLSVGLVQAYNSKTKKCKKAKIGVIVPQDRRNRCTSFQLKRSEVKVTGLQKRHEDDAYLAYTCLLIGWAITRRLRRVGWRLQRRLQAIDLTVVRPSS